MKKTFEQAVERESVRQRTREPAAIQRDIDKEIGRQKEAVKYTVALTLAETKRNGFKSNPEKLATGSDVIAVRKYRDQFNKAAEILAELDRELIVSESVRTVEA